MFGFRKRIRTVLSRILQPLDRVSYRFFSIVCRRRVAAAPLRLDDADKRILVLSPHQDDELLGCGGLLLMFAASRAVQVAYVSDGKGRPHRSPGEQQALVAIRQREARAVCSQLGVCEPIFLNLDDGCLAGDRALPNLLGDLIRRFRPNLVFVPFPTDAHPDHAATSMALAQVPEGVLDGIRILSYQVHSHIPDEFLNRFLEISDTVQQAKEYALRLYVSQDMLSPLTISKYLLFSKVAPQIGRRQGVASIEQFAELGVADFKALCQHLSVAGRGHRPSSTNYSPYSFRIFLRNRRRLSELLHGLRGR